MNKRCLIPMRLLLTGFVAGALATGCLAADENADEDLGTEGETPVSYWTEVRPIFQTHCQGCHQPAKRSGEYVMTAFDLLIGGGESGEAAIVAGDPKASYLIDQITPEDGKAEMPVGKPPLSEVEIAKVVRWVEEGAKNDTPASTAQVFDQENPPQYSAPPVLTAMQFSTDGKQLAVGGYHEVLIHDVEKLMAKQPSLLARLIGMSERIESIAYSPDGKQLAVAGGSPGRLGEVQLWNADDFSLKYSVPVTYDTCYGVSWSADGKLIGFGCPDNTVRAIKADSGEQVLFNGAHNDWVLDTIFSKDSTHIVTVSRDRSMKLIEVGTERFIDNITSITPGALKGGLNAVDRHPTEDQLLIGGADGVPKIYRMFREKARKIGDDFNLIRKFPGLPGRIYDVVFSRDATRVVAGSSFNGDGFVNVYNVADGKLVAELEEIGSAIFAVAVSPDGQTVASGGFSGDVFLHDASSGDLKRQFIPFTQDDEILADAAKQTDAAKQ